VGRQVVSYKGQLVGGDMTLCTPAVRFPDVCEKKVFRFFHSSVSRKQRLLKVLLFITDKGHVLENVRALFKSKVVISKICCKNQYWNIASRRIMLFKKRGAMTLHELDHRVAIGTLVELIYFDNTILFVFVIAGFSEWEDESILAAVLAESQKEYLENLKKGAAKDKSSDEDSKS